MSLGLHNTVREIRVFPILEKWKLKLASEDAAKWGSSGLSLHLGFSTYESCDLVQVPYLF